MTTRILSELRASAGRGLRHLAPARRQRWSLAMAALRAYGPGAGGIFLDAGCGDGLFTARLARSDRTRRILAADLSEAAVHAAAAERRRLGLANVLVVRTDLTRAVFGPRFDVVFALECLSEIPDDAAALRTMAGALRPGGLLVAHVPLADWRPVLPGSADRWRHEVRHGYHPDHFAECLRAAGLRMSAIRFTQRNVITAAQELRDRWKAAHRVAQAALYPAMAAASVLDTAGLTWGPPRGALVVARRVGATANGLPSRPVVEGSAPW